MLCLFLTGFDSCCPMVPLPDSWSFDYNNPNKETNFWKFAFMPQEIICLTLILILNPMTCYFLRKRVRNTDSVRENRIYLQIGIILIVFVLYMTIYYLYSNLQVLRNRKGVALLNSFLFTLNNMINPAIYFGLNPILRKDCCRLLTTTSSLQKATKFFN